MKEKFNHADLIKLKDALNRIIPGYKKLLRIHYSAEKLVNSNLILECKIAVEKDINLLERSAEMLEKEILQLQEFKELSEVTLEDICIPITIEDLEKMPNNYEELVNATEKLTTYAKRNKMINDWLLRIMTFIITIFFIFNNKSNWLTDNLYKVLPLVLVIGFIAYYFGAKEETKAIKLKKKMNHIFVKEKKFC